MQSTLISRGALAQKPIPEIMLSRAANPLTAPVLSTGLSATERAISRFSVSGNAIVTGGAGRLALAAIRALLEHGAANVAIFDLSPTLISSQHEIQKFRDEFPQAKVLTMEVDVTDEGAVDKGVQAVRSSLGTIDMLLCFAGVVAHNHAVDVSPAEWRKVLEINTTGSWLCAQAVAKEMMTQGQGGSIVFIASTAGRNIVYPQVQASYNVSKAGVLHLTKSLAVEWARYGIRVNSISPGYMRTIMTEGDSLEHLRKIWDERNPMGRVGEPDELAGVVILLCSRVAGRYITGEDIAVDGGGSVLLCEYL